MGDKPLIIDDFVYGRFEVNEPVLLKILSSPELERLKKISSGGYYPAWPELQREQFNRYHHSVGVFLLLRRFGASLEEQIAGLIHDVSHSAFSHTMDYIQKDAEKQKTHDYQDGIHDQFVKSSSLSKILIKYGFDVDYILDDSHFTLKENSIPDICADRIDYSLRQGLDNNEISRDEADFILKSLTVYGGCFVFNNDQAAQKFADFFWKMDHKHWSGMKSAVMFAVSAKLFRTAIEAGLLTFEDFYRLGDAEIIELIQQNKNQHPELAYLDELLHQTENVFTNDPNHYMDKIFCKIRRVNPYFINEDGKLERVGQRNTSFGKALADLPKNIEYFIRPLDPAEMAKAI